MCIVSYRLIDGGYVNDKVWSIEEFKEKWKYFRKVLSYCEVKVNGKLWIWNCKYGWKEF